MPRAGEYARRSHASTGYSAGSQCSSAGYVAERSALSGWRSHSMSRPARRDCATWPPHWPTWLHREPTGLRGWPTRLRGRSMRLGYGSEGLGESEVAIVERLTDDGALHSGGLERRERPQILHCGHPTRRDHTCFRTRRDIAQQVEIGPLKCAILTDVRDHITLCA